MADRRIRTAEEQVGFVEELTAQSDEVAGFRSKADVLAFAAALGFAAQQRAPFERAGGDPIRQEVFDRQGYGTLMDLIAVCENEQPQVLATSEEAEEERAVIFEEYANGGLQFLAKEVTGILDAGERLTRLVQLISKRKRGEEATADDLDITGLLG